MKEHTAKKSKLWPWIGILAAVLVCAGIALAVLLPGGNGDQPQNAPETDPGKIYWNVDLLHYTENSETGLSTREPAEDGLFHIRFAAGSELVELAVADRKLVNFIDSMQALCLTLDADGVIVEAQDAREVFAGNYKDFFVKKVEGDTAYINSSIAMNGMEIPLKLTESSNVMDVDPDSETLGAVEVPLTMDKITVFADASGAVTDLFISKRAVDGEVYWRVTRMYSSATGASTRKPNENGIYELEFAVGGQIVTLKCRDRNLVNSIDAATLEVFSFLFDEEGYIIKTMPVNQAIRGMVGCERVNIISLEEGSFTAKVILRTSMQGREYTVPMGDDCKIYLMETDCGEVAHIGQQVDSLKMGDLLTCYTDMDGKAQLIFIHRRLADSPMYYNLSRKGIVNGVTSRTKDEKGYYVFDMARQGKVVQVKTKDAAIATKIDNTWIQAMGLRLEGSIIQEVYSANCICGFTSTAYDYYVTSVAGNVIGMENVSTKETVTKILTQGCEIYDLFGGYGRSIGAVTTLQVGDKVRCFRNYGEDLTHVFVTQRYAEGAKLYFNTSYTWDSTKQETRRVPGEDGYYRLQMACNGKTVELKTKNRKLVNYIDSFGDKMIALKVSGDTVKDAWPAVGAVEHGKRVMYYMYVESVKGKEVTYYNYVLATGVKTVSATKYTLSDKCKVYNASTNVLSYRGEATTLRKGDRMVAYLDEGTQKVDLIYVIQRKEASELYWHVQRKYVPSATGITSREPDAEGYYVFDLAVNGEIKQFKTKDAAIATKVDQQTEAFGMVLKDDIIQHVVVAGNVQGVTGRTISYRDVMELSGSKATAIRLRTGAADYGMVSEIEFAKDCKFFDVSTYAESFGAAVELQLGDRISCWANDQGKIAYCYIVKRNTHKAGYISLCPHCNEEVFWDVFDGTVYEGNAHYYLPADMVGSKQLSCNQAGVDVVFDLNGFGYTSTGRFALVTAGTVSIVDTAGGGRLYKSVNNSNIAGLIGVSTDAVLNIYGGELCWQEDLTMAGRQGGILTVDRAVINMYGGTVRGGKADYVEGNSSHPYGGNIFITDGVFNMYGGTIEGGSSGYSGGNVHVAKNGIFNLYGGTVKGGTATYGGDIYVMGGSKTQPAAANLLGGTVEGRVEQNAYGSITLSGAPIIGDLRLGKGQLLTLGQLQPEASIKVFATDVFTAPNEKAAEYAPLFKTAEPGASVEAKDGALVYLAPVLSYTEPLRFVENTTTARCPVCGDMVQWTAITQETYGAAALGSKGGHYYLAEDITYSGTTVFMTMPGGSAKTCFHLNGHDLTATAAGVINGGGGTLNVMGSGTVAGTRTSATGAWNQSLGAVVQFNTSVKTGTLNIYSGTYTRTEASTANPVITAHASGGTLNVAADAVIDGSDGKYYAAVTYGVQLNLMGTTVKGDVLVGYYNTNGVGTLFAHGARITGNLLYQQGSVTLSGDVQLGKLTVAEGQKVTLGELEENVLIPVSAAGCFTEALEKPADYVKHFEAIDAGCRITAQENALYCSRDYVSNLQLDADKKAICPACGKVVTWTAVTQAAYGSTALGKVSGHYYLTEDITYSGTTVFMTLPSKNTSGCFHLNGHDITATAGNVIGGEGGTLNVMGSGTVAGTRTSWNSSFGATVSFNTSLTTGVLNLYSGTYTRTEACGSYPVIAARASKGGVLNVYADAVIDGSDGKYYAAATSGVTLKLIGTTVKGDVLVGEHDGTSVGTLVIDSATVTGKVEFTAGSLTLVGDPILGELIVAEGLQVTEQ